MSLCLSKGTPSTYLEGEETQARTHACATLAHRVTENARAGTRTDDDDDCVEEEEEVWVRALVCALEPSHVDVTKHDPPQCQQVGHDVTARQRAAPHQLQFA